jgi:hypothetical protein
MKLAVAPAANAGHHFRKGAAIVSRLVNANWRSEHVEATGDAWDICDANDTNPRRRDETRGRPVVSAIRTAKNAERPIHCQQSTREIGVGGQHYSG